VRLAGDRGERLSTPVAECLVVMGSEETDAEVRAQLAATGQRISSAWALPLVTALCQREADAADAYQPLLVWWAWVKHADDRAAVARWLADPALWQSARLRTELAPRIMRRYASGGHDDLLMCAELLERAPDAAARAALLESFEQAFAGRTLSDIPTPLANALQKAGGGSVSLRARLGDTDAVEQVIRELLARETPLARRIEHARLLGDVHQSQARQALIDVLSSDEPNLLITTLAALGGVDDEQVADEVLRRWSSWPIAAQQAALRLLASRPSWSLRLLDALDDGRVTVESVPEDAVQQLRWLAQPSIRDRVDRRWPARLPRDEAARIESERQRLATAIAAGPADPYQGRALFMQHCGKCHTLFRQGGQIGPNLTSYPRDDVARLIGHVVHPSAEIREGYEMWIATRQDGRVVSGFLLDQDPQTWVLRTIDGENVRVPRADVEQFQRSPESLMPRALTEPLDSQQIRDLFAFLRQSQPLNEP
jgi:putative heme-binding domain-containing protein